MALNATVFGAMPPMPDPNQNHGAIGGGNNITNGSADRLTPYADRPPKVPFPASSAQGGRYEMVSLLKTCVEQGASDLHMAVGRPPCLRINGSIRDLDGPVLNGGEARRLIYGILNDAQKQKFEENKELDFSLSVTNLSRFRVNIHLQRGTVAASIRVIDSTIRSFEDLHLPKRIMEYLARRPAGFCLITGPTGSGKSTSLASMVDLINRERDCHVITIEDPIEYLHPHKRALIEQREVNEDTLSFANALKFALRQDPDVLMVGEMRDLETISSAITAAETGHLVFSTLHTIGVVQTVDRIIDVFPPHQQEQVRIQLAAVMEGVICQKLLPSLHRGREIAVEVMIATDAVRNQIREGNSHMIQGTIEAGGKWGMVTMDRSILDLFRQGRISRETALLACNKPEEMKRQIG